MSIDYLLDVETLEKSQVDTLALNEIGRVWIGTTQLLAVDDYESNHDTGGFVLIDPVDNVPVMAGMIDEVEAGTSTGQSEAARDLRNQRESSQGYRSALVITEGPAEADTLESELRVVGMRTLLLTEETTEPLGLVTPGQWSFLAEFANNQGTVVVSAMPWDVIDLKGGLGKLELIDVRDLELSGRAAYVRRVLNLTTKPID